MPIFGLGLGAAGTAEPWGSIDAGVTGPSTAPTTAWCARLSASSSRPIVIVRIEALGTNSGQYAFSSRVPDYAATDPIYLGWLRSWPNILSERVDPLGGSIELGECSVDLLDGNGDLLTDLFAFDRAAHTRLSADVSGTDPTIQVAASAGIAPNALVYVGSECLLVTAVAGTTLTVTRARLDTVALPHVNGDDVFLKPPHLRDRRLRLFIGFDGLTAADEFEIATYLVDNAELRELNTWSIRAGSTLVLLDRRIARGRGATGNVVSSRPATPGVTSGAVLSEATIDQPTYPQLPGVTGTFLRIGDEVVGLAGGPADGQQGGPISIAVASDFRGLATSKREDQLDAPDPHRLDLPLAEVLVADSDVTGSSFRYQAAGIETASRSTGTWIASDHPVPILLNLLTSSADPDDGLAGANYATGKGNFSFLPPGLKTSGRRRAGVGAGIPAALIDFDSFLAVWRAHPEWRLRALTLGDETRSFRELATDLVLKPFGWFLTARSGKIALVAPRPLLPLDTKFDVGPSAIREENGEPVFAQRIVLDHVARGVTFKISGTGGRTIEVQANDADADRIFQQRATFRDGQGIEIAAKALRYDAAASVAIRNRAMALLARVRRPLLTFSVRTHPDLFCDVAVGDFVRLTFAQAADPTSGKRGVSNFGCAIIERTLTVDEDGVRLDLGLVAYGVGAAYRHVGPAARTTNAGVAAGADVNVGVEANRYTTGSGVSTLPARDALGFRALDVVQLRNRDGSSASALTQTVVQTEPGGALNQIRLNGNFGGALVSGLVLRLAPYDLAVQNQKDTFGYQADTTAYTIGASGDAPNRYAEA